MVPYTGRSTLRPTKPKKWAYKFYVLSGMNGVVHNFKIHVRSIAVCHDQPNLNASGNIVLLPHIPRDKWGIENT